MAKELARYIEEKLSQMPQDHPDRSLLETVEKMAKSRLNSTEQEDELAHYREIGKTLYEKIIKDLDDGYLLKEILANNDFKNLGFNSTDLTSVTRIFRALIRPDRDHDFEFRFETVGDVRTAGMDEISRKRRVGVKGVAIVFEAFKKPEIDENR